VQKYPILECYNFRKLIELIELNQNPHIGYVQPYQIGNVFFIKIEDIPQDFPQVNLRV
jgi:hypothetical protein